jgi:hypothetical protein
MIKRRVGKVLNSKGSFICMVTRMIPIAKEKFKTKAKSSMKLGRGTKSMPMIMITNAERTFD